MYPYAIDGTTTHDLYQEFPYVNSSPIKYQIALSLLQVVDKAAPPTKNAQFPAFSSVFFVFQSIGEKKTNHPLQSIDVDT